MRRVLLVTGTLSVLALACDSRRYSLGRPGGRAQRGDGGASSGSAGVGSGAAGTPATAGLGGAGGRGGGKAGMGEGGAAGELGGGEGGTDVGGTGAGGTSVTGGEGGEGDAGTGGISATGGALGGAGTGTGGSDVFAACNGGTGGSAGSNSGCPTCRGGTNVVSGCVVFENALAEGPLTETVTVVSTEDVVGDACPTPFDEGGQATSRLIVLEAADSRRWSVFVRVPNLPADIVAVNDSVELVVDYDEGFFVTRASQFVSLSQDGERIVVLFTGPDTMGPMLAEQGIELTRLGRLCDAIGCGLEDLRARVKIGPSEAVFDPDETKQLQDLRLTIDEHAQWDSGIGGCDNGGVLQGGGFVAPSSASRSTVPVNSR
jgi:hypothetical protein